MIQSQTQQQQQQQQHQPLTRVFINSPITTLNGTNLKYICEVCGILFQNIDSLKQHLKIHGDVQHQQQQQHHKSILSLAKHNGLIQTIKKKTNQPIISIPQSMTVFNLKDISSKLVNNNSLITQHQSQSQTTTTIQSPPIITSPIVKNEIKKDDSNQQQQNQTVFQLEEPINFLDLKNEQFLELSTPNSNQDNNNLAALPYHYSEIDNIYICNLCNCTYDSLRSIKAHLWKHSGHHELCYPIHKDCNISSSSSSSCSGSNNNNNNSHRIAETTGKPIVTLKTEPTTRKTIRQTLQIPQHVNSDNQTNQTGGSGVGVNGNGGGGGGICSALLEVIEKLRETETLQQPLLSKRKRKTNLQTINKEPKIRKKRKTTQKVNQLIQLQDEINLNNLKQQEVINNILNNQNTECTIETTVVNSLYEDQDTLLNKLVNQQQQQEEQRHDINEQQEQQKDQKISKIGFFCQECQVLTNCLNKHVCTIGKNDLLNECEFDHFLCHLCKNESERVVGVGEEEGMYEEYECKWYKKFDNFESLKTHFNLNHTTESMDSPTTPASPCLNIINQNNSELLKLLELLANNDGNEQYACGLCLYVCYHLPSLKSHMWSHVKSEKFDYTINTSIINAALDYENKLNRSLALIHNSIKFRKCFNSSCDDSKEDSCDSIGSSDLDDLNFSLSKKIQMTLDMINFKDIENRYKHEELEQKQRPESCMVAFKCSKCNFETVDLCFLRIHKRNHF
ncbi:unnamed protein product [Brachionus calyciflorus]|uniref:C2H2-type domain-containing protein n=1 Tax=Brachionus calyciflorus TaxID=104777 RepID=A0A813NUW0_9BILA|nr:unnamed protein product [Brachionus calyciflorus]